VKPDYMVIKEKLRHKLGMGRFEHTLGVAYTAACLAMRYGCNAENAELAGLLHDCAKQYDNETLLKKCIKHHIPVSEAERKNPSLLHAKLGEYLARKKYDVDDPDILDAIRYHTTGRPAMSLMEKVIYVADYIEPRRFKAPNLDRIRGLAFVDLDKAVCGIMSDTLDYLKKTPENIDKTTEEACLYYRELHEHTYLSNDSQE
jgi:predicted HD superfamily hydrolase involved in NAD metabolism